MSMVLSFLGGAAKQLTTDIEQAEENAREDAKLGFSALYKRYEENAKSNRELTSKMNEDEQWVKTNYNNATPEQVAALVGNPVALEALKKTDDPYKIDLDNYIKIAQGNESPAVQAERIQALPSMVGKIKESMSTKMEAPKNRSPLGGLISDFGETSYDSTMGRLAKSQGMSLKDLQATSRNQRTNTGAKFDMSTLAKAPDSVEDMVKTANVARVQAKQKFGEGSDEYKTATQAYVDISKEIDKVDKGLTARADRLGIAILDETDPAKKKSLQSELKTTQQAIKSHKEATSTSAERGDDKPKKYSVISRSIDDFVNTRMKEDKGFDWKKYVDFKTFTDPASGETITSRTQKAGLDEQAQRELFAKERELTAQALTTNGYVVNGKPRYSEVAEIMNNRNITPQSFGAPAPAPVATPAPAPTAAPAAAPAPAQPATAQPAKVVSVAKVQEQAKANNVPYEEAAAAARKQGYTIR